MAAFQQEVRSVHNFRYLSEAVINMFNLFLSVEAGLQLEEIPLALIVQNLLNEHGKLYKGFGKIVHQPII